MADALTPPLAEAVDAIAWRNAMGRFPSGVTVVTSWSGRNPVGTTVNALCSVSLEPPLLLVCLDLTNPALPPVERCGVFGVNMLAHDHAHLARRFSREPETDRFAGLDWRAHPHGAPELAVATVFIDCALVQAHGAGDHRIVIGKGLRINHNSAEPPLLYHRGAFPKMP